MYQLHPTKKTRIKSKLTNRGMKYLFVGYSVCNYTDTLIFIKFHNH